MNHHADVLIVGGGVIGLTTAFYLTEEGARVTVIDQADFGRQSSWAGAGILPQGNELTASDPVDQFRSRSSRMFVDLSAKLRDRTSIDNGYMLSGGIELLDAEEVDDEEWRSGGADIIHLDSARLHELEPLLSPSLSEGYYLPAMAQVRNPRHIQSLLAACHLNHADLLPNCPVHALSPHGKSVRVETKDGRIEANRVMVAGGAWTDQLLAGLGWSLGVKPIRGQIALLNTGQQKLQHILLWGKRYLVPRDDGRVLVGSTEEDAGFDPRATASVVSELINLGVSIVPALADATVERAWAGSRPGSPDGLPYLDRLPDSDNVFIAAGHFRSGITLSPASGWVMKELLLDRPPSLPDPKGEPRPIDLTPFRAQGRARRLSRE
jgi:glycine oxidase